MKCVRRYDFGCVTLGTNLFVTCKLWVDERDFESLDGDGFEKGLGGGGGVCHQVSTMKYCIHHYHKCGE